MSHELMLYQFALTPDATLGVEDTGNVVLMTSERRITITNVRKWIAQLELAQIAAREVSKDRPEPEPRDEDGHTMADYRNDPGLIYENP